MDNDSQISKYDRLRGAMAGVALFTKPSTVKNVEIVTGKAETFVVETGRHHELGDYIFVEMIDEDRTVTRMALPPRVSNAIAAQRDALTARRRSISGRLVAKQRAEAGILPGFMKHKRK